MMHKPTGVMCAACNLAGITREIVGYVNDTVPYATVRWDVMGDPRKRVPVCQTCADWRETVDHDDLACSACNSGPFSPDTESCQSCGETGALVWADEQTRTDDGILRRCRHD